MPGEEGLSRASGSLGRTRRVCYGCPVTIFTEQHEGPHVEMTNDLITSRMAS